MGPEWQGNERRKNRQPVHCLHEEDWGALKTTVENLDKRINGSLDQIAAHMDSGVGWRMAILGLVFSVIIQIGTFLFLWGSLTKEVEIGSERWDSLIRHHGYLLSEPNATRTDS